MTARRALELPLRRAWGTARRSTFHSSYRRRRDAYQRMAEETGVIYSQESSTAAVRERLANRGYDPPRRRLGDIHTVAFVPSLGWHEALIPDLRELGPLTRFDYVADLSVPWTTLARRDRRALEARKTIGERLLARVRGAHRQRHVDWVFVYASGLEIEASTVERIQEEHGIPVVGMCLDDKQSWDLGAFGDTRGGQIDLARPLDLAWTSARVACEWYLVEGGRPLYLPEGFDASTCGPTGEVQDLPVTFVGGAYGSRPALIGAARKAGLPVRAFGAGWENEGVWGADQTRVFSRSVVNLGMGGIGYSDAIMNVKTRDFEIPGTGGGAYLTTYSADLADHFRVGDEILCYHGVDELVEISRRCLRERDWAAGVAARGHQRAMREHRWLHRYQAICSAVGII